jgi:CXXC-20-CXXC protein
MKTRTCPYCNYKYSFRDYISNLLIKLIWDEWNCKNCSEIITFNARRRLLVSLCFGIWVAIILIIQANSSRSIVTWILTLALFIAGSILIFTFDTFEKVKKE